MIDYRIMGVPKRNSNISVLQDILGITDNAIFLDTEYRKNPMWTWKQTARLDTGIDATHICIVQDDAVLCDDFKEFCEYIVNRFPNAIFLPYNRKNFDGVLPRGCIFQPNYVCGGVVSIIPKKYINDIIDEHESNHPDHKHDDMWLCYWAHWHDVPVYSVYPSVVDTLESEDGIDSALNHSDDRKSYSYESKPFSRHWANATQTKLLTRDWTSLKSIWD